LPSLRRLNQPILIENVIGAGGTIGSTRTIKAQPDGYTLLSGNLGSLGAAFELYKKLQYGPSDISSIGMIAGTPNFLVVRKDFPAKTLSEFVAHAKANPAGLRSATQVSGPMLTWFVFSLRTSPR
jgi:putative tricarboxylic transport membrane protein